MLLYNLDNNPYIVLKIAKYCLPDNCKSLGGYILKKGVKKFPKDKDLKFEYAKYLLFSKKRDRGVKILKKFINDQKYGRESIYLLSNFLTTKQFLKLKINKTVYKKGDKRGEEINFIYFWENFLDLNSDKQLKFLKYLKSGKMVYQYLYLIKKMGDNGAISKDILVDHLDFLLNNPHFINGEAILLLLQR